nr:chymotrypsin-1-like [Nomia melanderi]
MADIVRLLVPNSIAVSLYTALKHFTPCNTISKDRSASNTVQIVIGHVCNSFTSDFSVNAGDTKPKDPVNSQLGWFPYVVSVRVDNQHVCGGAILDSTHVLTAAHCLTEHVNNPGSVEVVTSAVLLDQGGELHRASRFVVPPAYPKVDELDIAVIKLQDPIVENQYQHRIALSQVKPPTNTYALLVGWGEIPNSKPPRLTNAQQYVYIWIIDTDKCNAYYQREHGQHICTSTRSNYGVCPTSGV